VTSLTADDVLRAKAKARSRVERALRGRSVQSLRWWWAPGRVEVFGKHTDYGGGPSLVGALPRGILVAGARRHDQRLCIVDARDGTRYELDLSTGVVAAGEAIGWRRYADVVARRLGRNFPGASLAADIALASDLPRAAGMSSSSALVVGLAHALVRLAELDRRDDWRAAVRSELDLAGYYACLENGRSFGPLEGDGGVGTAAHRDLGVPDEAVVREHADALGRQVEAGALPVADDVGLLDRDLSRGFDLAGVHELVDGARVSRHERAHRVAGQPEVIDVVHPLGHSRSPSSGWSRPMDRRKAASPSTTSSWSPRTRSSGRSTSIWFSASSPSRRLRRRTPFSR
jgi:hypothetical protein